MEKSNQDGTTDEWTRLAELSFWRDWKCDAGWDMGLKDDDNDDDDDYDDDYDNWGDDYLAWPIPWRLAVVFYRVARWLRTGN